PEYLKVYPIILIIWSVLLFAYHSYHSHRTVPVTREALTVLRVVVVGNVILATLAYLLPLRQLSRAWFILFGVLSAIFLLLEKIALRVIARYVRAKGLNYRTILIVGTGRRAQEARRDEADLPDVRGARHPRPRGHELLLQPSGPHRARRAGRHPVPDLHHHAVRRDAARVQASARRERLHAAAGAGHAGDRPRRAGHQVLLARIRLLQAGAHRAERTHLHALQVPHDDRPRARVARRGQSSQ